VKAIKEHRIIFAALRVSRTRAARAVSAAARCARIAHLCTLVLRGRAGMTLGEQTNAHQFRHQKHGRFAGRISLLAITR